MRRPSRRTLAAATGLSKEVVRYAVNTIKLADGRGVVDAESVGSMLTGTQRTS